MEENRSYSIGDLARRSGLSVRTIRFYSDVGVVPVTARSASGYRLYDVEAVAAWTSSAHCATWGFRSSRLGRC